MNAGDDRRKPSPGRGALFFVLLSPFVLAAATLPATATEPARVPELRLQEPQPQDLHPEAREAISKIRSPFCPGLMLEVCPTRQAQALRDSIQAGAETGLSADSLLEMVVAAHGEEYRAFPKSSGAGLLAWLMPPAALLVGLGLVVVALRRLMGPRSRAADEGLTEQEMERLQAALTEFDEMEEAER